MSLTNREIYYTPQSSEGNNHFADKEWLVTNGLGGYSSMSLLGGLLRKYHSLLVAALPAPLGRYIMLAYIDDFITTNQGSKFPLSQLDLYESEENVSQNVPLEKFQLEDGLPIWTYRTEEITLEKRIFMDHHKNTTYFSYELLKSHEPVELTFRPFFQFRHHEASPASAALAPIECVKHENMIFEFFSESLPSLNITASHFIKSFEDEKMIKSVRYRFEEERGYESKGNLISSGYFTIILSPHEKIVFAASTEAIDTLKSIEYHSLLEKEKYRRTQLTNIDQKGNDSLKEKFGLELLLAADQFIILPFTRVLDIALSKLQGGDARTVIAGYHWFTDWGRDTMISLEGLLLLTGRIKEARDVLQTYSFHLRDGLIPNMFPDKENEGKYNTADATLWFFHAIDRYLAYSHDTDLLIEFLPKLKEILHFHIKGTRFGIHVDVNDGLLIQGQEGVALTWMDAVVGDFVVTPRRGKAVEINALWYNALCLLIEWMELLGEDPHEFKKWAEACHLSFNEKFWIEEKKYLYDIVEGEKGNDPAFRPNQLFAISLKYPVLKKEQWDSVIQNVYNKLFTVFGLRTLSSDHPDYKVAYQGNLFLRDSAYHQGTVWPWLIGPFIDAWLKVYPDKKNQAKMFLDKFNNHLSEGCIGTISEIFDAEKPFSHRGCIAQAWSVAEVLRSWVKTSSTLNRKSVQ